jgi:hypothetical protein
LTWEGADGTIVEEYNNDGQAPRGRTFEHTLKRSRKGKSMTIMEIVAVAAVVIGIGTNVALYTLLSSAMNSRFDSLERRLELIQERIAKAEPRR